MQRDEDKEQEDNEDGMDMLSFDARSMFSLLPLCIVPHPKKKDNQVYLEHSNSLLKYKFLKLKSYCHLSDMATISRPKGKYFFVLHVQYKCSVN